jgi:tRNA A-37 threonylcarbamoyl transferase component Bud32
MSRTYILPLTKPYFPRSALSGDNLEYWIGRQEELDRVVRGLTASTGTHYLVTGYPGVGKSSFVSRAVSEWRKISAAQGIDRLLIFNLHFADSQTSDDVVKRLIGKVYFASVDGQFAPTKKLAKRLELTYIHAQSKSVKETQGQSLTSESATEGKLNLPQALSLFQGLGITSKKSKELSRSLEVNREYNASLATNDFESILHLLTQPASFHVGFFGRLRRQFSRFRNIENGSRVLFIFDQIDDLSFVEQIGSFLNLPNASFIVLGGPKLQQQVSSARELGVHVLDNFDEVYLNCHWDQAHETLKLLIDPKYLRNHKYADYRDYLNFCSQGLPRRLFAAMDRHTSRKGNQFFLKISAAEQVRTRLCAELHRVVWKHRKDILGRYIDSVQHPFRDKALRGAYHLTDRIFRIIRFSFQDANTVATQMSATIMHPSRERVLRNLLKVFENYGMLLKEGSEYRLSDDVLNQVKHIPDWLTDGFVDMQELLEEVRKFDESGSDSSKAVEVIPGRDLMPRGPKSEKVNDSGSSLDSDSTQQNEPNIGSEQKRQVGRRARSDAKSDSRSGRISAVEQETNNLVSNETQLEPRKRKLPVRTHGRENQMVNERYLIRQLVGRGGMSEVYVAEDIRLSKRAVVIKILNEGGFQNEWVSQKFRQEIEALSRVFHPGIVNVLDSGETAEGLPYIVMEYVKGNTLRRLIGSGEMSLTRIRDIIAQLSNALETVHRHGIIHRDLKPENILISSLPDGTEHVRIIDFGIAKIKASVVATTTAPGLVAGTVAYMPPEQIRGERITPASDIYALGVISFEMVTGRRPFSPETVFQLFEMQRAGVTVRPSDLRPGLSREAEAVLLKALSFDPKDRYQQAQDFAAAFSSALH